jgi:nucleoside-diphosphate-sugar epimerase
MRITVVGASGFLGTEVVAELVRRGHEPTAVARTARPGVDRTLDVTTATDTELRAVLAGHDGVVFAAGVDDRTVPRTPAYRTFHHGNVVPVRRLLAAAREVGVSRAVVHGSYFAHFAVARPEWELARRNPYIRSRLEQARVARASGLPVAVLQIPFVFGRVGDRRPGWAEPLVRLARSRLPLAVPPGGTAGTSVARVAEATATALEQASAADIPLPGENLTWTELLTRAAAAAGRPRRVRHLPAAPVRATVRFAALLGTAAGRQSGLDVGDTLLRELFLYPAVPGSLTAAIDATFAP